MNSDKDSEKEGAECGIRTEVMKMRKSVVLSIE